MSQLDTRTRILDVAEELFADKGYRGTSMRAITARAEVNLAAVNYHFGSKQGLVTEVIERRLVPLNRLREQNLNAVREKAAKIKKIPELERVLLAFIEPTLMLPESTPGAKNFITLISRAMADTDQTAREIFVRNMKQIITLFYNCLAEALPEISPDVLYWRLNFVIGALSHTMRSIDKCPVPMAEGVPHDSRSLVKLLLPFIRAGMEAPQ
ncbi:MAG: TetR/AcrR family transcriptional regulator [Desulfurivibrionaceae bacterium]